MFSYDDANIFHKVQIFFRLQFIWLECTGGRGASPGRSPPAGWDPPPRWRAGGRALETRQLYSGSLCFVLCVELETNRHEVWLGRSPGLGAMIEKLCESLFPTLALVLCQMLGHCARLRVWKLGLIIQQSVSPEGTGQYLYLQQQWPEHNKTHAVVTWNICKIFMAFILSIKSRCSNQASYTRGECWLPAPLVAKLNTVSGCVRPKMFSGRTLDNKIINTILT